jgi:hypothetical protein
MFSETGHGDTEGTEFIRIFIWFLRVYVSPYPVAVY